MSMSISMYAHGSLVKLYVVQRALLLALLLIACGAPLAAASTVESTVENSADSAVESTDESTADEQLRINMYVDHATAAIGDELVIHIDYQYPHAWINERSALPNPDVTLSDAGVFLLQAPPVVAQTVGDMQHYAYSVTVLVQRSGSWSLPRPVFSVLDNDGVRHQATAPEVLIQVGSDSHPPRLAAASALWSAADGGADNGASRLWLWILAGVLITALALALLLLLRRHKKSTLNVLSPLELFQEHMTRCQSADDGKEAAAALSQGIRRFCGALWDFDGAGTTVRELRTRLQHHLKSEQLRQVCVLLENIESLRWTPAAAQLTQIHTLAATAHVWCSELQTQVTAERAAAALLAADSSPTTTSTITTSTPAPVSATGKPTS